MIQLVSSSKGWRGLVLFCGCLLLGGGAVLHTQADGLSNQRYKPLAVVMPGQLIDTLTVVPSSLGVYASASARDPLPPDSYQLVGRYLQWRQRPTTDTVWLVYRVLPFDLLARSQLIDTSRLERNERGQLIGRYNPYIRSDLFDTDGRVNYQGAFSRGFSLGNRQDLVLNSAFNLQMEGELGNGLRIRAAITDDNLPIQAAGNTQQLREFDKIFIQLAKDRTTLTAGDYELRNPDGYFMRYFKKLEGATVTTQSGAKTPEEGGRWSQSASVAIARGQFIRSNIVPGEGNQGPYRLSGNGGTNRFLIILSGTERIYLDGQLLRRGQDADYVIDYNLAELTFTNRRLITRDSRITAEYEYADQRYLRTLLAADTRYEQGAWTAYASLFTQQDSKTATGDLRLTPEQKRSLSLAGDAAMGVLVSAIDTLEGRSDQRATYLQTDSLINCGGQLIPQPILRFTTEDVPNLVTAAFTNFGPNGGPYELLPPDQANERVYRFVGFDPVSCEPLGNYRPEILLAAPRKDQLLTLGGSYQKKGSQIQAELARSSVDLNRFSELDSEDDHGLAARFDARQIIPLSAKDSSWQLIPHLEYEYLQSTFQPLNPYRSPEFFRDWNLSNRLGIEQPNASEERLFGSGLTLQAASWGQLSYAYGQYLRGDDYQGRRHSSSLRFHQAGWMLLANINQLQNKGENRQGSFLQPQLSIRKKIGAHWEISSEYSAERSEQRLLGQDTLLPFSFSFNRFALGLAGQQADKYTFQLQARRRTDALPDGSTDLLQATQADELLWEGQYEASKNIRFGGNMTYRSLAVSAPDLANQEPGQTFLGRLDLTIKLLENSLRSQTAYTIGSGQEPRQEFQYLFVGAGRGQYIWQDSLYNNDGRIQPNEMEIAPFSDIADYVRVSVFTNDFIRTDNVGINQSWNWEPSRLWKEPQPWQKALKKISLQSSISLDRKTRESEEVQPWNPFQLGVSDSILVALSAGSRHSLFFNRANPRYDLQLSQRDINRRQVLTTGYEANRQQTWELIFRYRPNSSLNLIAAASQGVRFNDSENFNNKDYQIQFQRLTPAIEWQIGEDFRCDINASIGRERNVLAGGEGENTRRREVKWKADFRRWLRLELSNINIQLEGQSNSPVGFALLNGLQPGRNWLWNLNATQQLGQYLQLSLSYEGRQTGQAPTVHVGRAQVTALF